MRVGKQPHALYCATLHQLCVRPCSHKRQTTTLGFTSTLESHLFYGMLYIERVEKRAYYVLSIKYDGYDICQFFRLSISPLFHLVFMVSESQKQVECQIEVSIYQEPIIGEGIAKSPKNNQFWSRVVNERGFWS